MRIEVKCVHPRHKRTDCGSGWMCETEKGGCGATGSGETSHWSTVLYYIDVDLEEIIKACRDSRRLK